MDCTAFDQITNIMGTAIMEHIFHMHTDFKMAQYFNLVLTKIRVNILITAHKIIPEWVPYQTKSTIEKKIKKSTIL